MFFVTLSLLFVVFPNSIYLLILTKNLIYFLHIRIFITIFLYKAYRMLLFLTK